MGNKERGALLRIPPKQCNFRVDIFIEIHRVTMYHASVIRKELVAASAEPLILSLLARGESYGYAIIQDIKARSQSKMQWTDGMLYPVLHRLEHRGLIKSRWSESDTGRKRKYYSLKKDGKKALEKHHEQWSVVNAVLAGLRKEQNA
jgi:PadR family transcriptional regulator, regulatory protein PadR